MEEVVLMKKKQIRVKKNRKPAKDLPISVYEILSYMHLDVVKLRLRNKVSIILLLAAKDFYSCLEILYGN